MIYSAPEAIQDKWYLFVYRTPHDPVTHAYTLEFKDGEKKLKT